MMNVPYLHYPKDERSLKKAYLIAILLLWAFGFYKNGILLYQNDYISFLDLFIPIYFLGVSAGVSLLVAFLLKQDLFLYLIYGLILGASISINTNMILYPILLFVALFITSYIDQKRSIPVVPLTRLLLVLAILVQTYSYLNVSEKIGAFNYDYFDLFLGYGVGGIASSSLLFVILAFFILLFNPFYKRMIPVMASFSFILGSALLFLITRDSSYITTLLNGTVYFSFVFVATLFYNTPITKKGMISYGLCIGLVSALLSAFLPIYEVGFLSIFLFSLFPSIFDRILQKKHLHS